MDEQPTPPQETPTAPVGIPVKWTIEVGTEGIVLSGTLIKGEETTNMHYDETLKLLQSAPADVLLAVAHLRNLTAACFHEHVERINRERVNQVFGGEPTAIPLPPKDLPPATEEPVAESAPEEVTAVEPEEPQPDQPVA